MGDIGRRGFLGYSLAGGAAALAAPADSKKAAGPPPPVTRLLSRYAVRGQFADIPAPVRKEAARTLLNWVGCALGGSRNETVPIAISALSPFFGPAQATILGRKERADIFHAALINGISSHVLDFDDTHMATAIHPAASVVPAILALAEYIPVSGRDFLNAMVLGIEVECRLGAAVHPAHYDIGWHITGTTGVFGAAAAAGRLLNLSEQQMIWALGLAAVQPVGLRAMFGSMAKSFTPGARRRTDSRRRCWPPRITPVRIRGSRPSPVGPTWSVRNMITPISKTSSASPTCSAPIAINRSPAVWWFTR